MLQHGQFPHTPDPWLVEFGEVIDVNATDHGLTGHGTGLMTLPLAHVGQRAAPVLVLR